MTSTTICRQPRAPRRFPFWTLPLVMLTVVGSFAGGHSLEPLWVLSWVPGIVGAFALAMWLEDRLTLPFAVRSAATRAGVALAVVAGGIAGNAAMTALHTLFLILGFDSGIFLVAQLFFSWLASAAVGGLPVIVVSSLGARLFPGFHRQLQFSVLVLLAIALLISVVVGVLGITLVDAIDHHEAHLLLSDTSVAGFDITPQRFAERFGAVLDAPALIVVFAALVGALYGLPAALAATRKMADSMVERITPLAAGFDRLSSGERSLDVEVGGPRELAQIIQRFNMLVMALALAERMERAFGQYVSRHVLDLIRAQHGEAALPAATRVATVFFADIRGFTSMSERLTPAAVVAVLNRYFERVVRIVNEHDGYLNKFIGDAVVVVFNGPIDQPDHAARATTCAIALQKTVAEMNAVGAFPEIGKLEVGVGIATGPMVCGNIGGSNQIEYTVIGDTVNLSSRLTSKAGPGEVWISDETARALPASLPTTLLEAIAVKGKAQPVVPHRAWPSP